MKSEWDLEKVITQDILCQAHAGVDYDARWTRNTCYASAAISDLARLQNTELAAAHGHRHSGTQTRSYVRRVLWFGPPRVASTDCLDRCMDQYLIVLKDFASTHALYAYITVSLLALSEAIPVVGTVVPGSTLVFGISALAISADADPWILLLAATAGAIAGDCFSFWLGQHYRERILRAWPLSHYPQLITRSEQLIAKFGAASVVLARFMAVVRAFVPLIAGILRMSPWQFYSANIISAVIWASAHVFPGIMLAAVLRLAGASAEQRTIIIVSGIAVIFVIFATRMYYKTR